MPNEYSLKFVTKCRCLPLKLFDSGPRSEPVVVQATNRQRIRYRDVHNQGKRGNVLLLDEHCPCRCDRIHPEVAVDLASPWLV